MGDLTVFDLPPPDTPATPASAAVPEPAAGPSVVPRLPRRVHFCDMLPPPHVWLPPAADAATATHEGDTQEADEPVMGDEDKMDLLWEDFNEELLAMRRAGLLHNHELPAESSSSDGEDDLAAARRAPVGCFPVLRPAARAGLAAGHYRYRHRADTSWVLLMRIFRRLFVVDKTITSSSSSSAARHAAASSSRSSKRR